MQVPHDAMVLVADGRKMLLLRNEGDAEFPNLQVEKKQLHPNPKDSDQKRDQSGHSSSTQTGQGAPAVAQNGSMHARGGGAQFAPSRGSMGETDFHQLEEDKFAAETAAMLELLASLRDGHAILLVEHDMDAVFRIADRITVMVNGAVIASDTPAAVRASADVQSAYLGEAA